MTINVLTSHKHITYIMNANMLNMLYNYNTLIECNLQSLVSKCNSSQEVLSLYNTTLLIEFIDDWIKRNPGILN